MFIALVIFNVTHPGKVLVGPDAEWPKQTKAERKAAKEAKKAAKQEKKREKAEEKNNGTREKVRRESSGTAILVDSSSTEDQIQPHTDAV